MTQENNYNWNTYINDRAIVEFEKEHGLENVKLGMNAYYLLSYFINLYISPKKGKNIIYTFINEEKFIYVSSSFIIKNLRLLKIKKRSIVRTIENLESHGYIERSIQHGSLRYIKISDNLLKYILPNQFIRIKSTRLNKLSKKVGKSFAKTSESQLNEVFDFLSKLSDINHFETQFNNYVEFKDYTNEIPHRFEKYCDIWDSQNWKLLLEQHKAMDEKDLINKFY